MKTNFLSGIIDAIFSGKKIDIVWEKENEQPRDRIGRWTKKQAQVIFYGDLIRSVAK